MFPEARSAGRWLLHGWHVTLAYVVGFFALLFILGWHPHATHKAEAIDAVKPTIVAVGEARADDRPATGLNPHRPT